MSVYNAHKVTALPSSYAANDLFFVAPAGQPNELEIHLANSAGTALRRINTTSDIQALIDATIALQSTGLVADDIAARDAIAAPNDGQQVLVLDATADTTVDSGAATYVYRASTAEYIKVSEAESLDLQLTWTALSGKPNAAPVDIDDAVAKRHAHANLSELDKISQDANGNMTYDGALITTGWATEAW